MHISNFFVKVRQARARASAKFVAGALCAAVVFLATSPVPAFAEAVAKSSSITGGSATTEVKATVDNGLLCITAPTQIDVKITGAGSFIESTSTITNNSVFPVSMVNLRIEVESGWSLKGGQNNFNNSNDEKSFWLQICPDNGTYTISTNNAATANGMNISSGSQYTKMYKSGSSGSTVYEDDKINLVIKGGAKNLGNMNQPQKFMTIHWSFKSV